MCCGVVCVDRKEYKIGDKAEFSKTVSESDVYLFAGITGDMNPIHINETEAATSFVKKELCMVLF